MTTAASRPGVDSPYAWRLAFVSMFCIGLGGGALYLPVVGLKEIAAEFGDRRAVPSMAYMLGFFFMGIGGVLMGWLADRTSPRVPLMIAGVSILAALAVGGPLGLLAGAGRGADQLLGRVMEGSCGGGLADEHAGVAGVRVFLEDGTHVVTD